VIAVTGATGELGSRVAARLAERGVRQRLVVPDPARAPDLGAEIAIAPGYHDGEAMEDALRGADTLYLVSGRESADRVAEHFSAVDAAARAGVQRIVYTSFVGAAPDTTFTLARHHHATEERIRAAGMAHTFLRHSMYLDFVPFFARADGVIAGPAGDGRTAWVSRDDAADVAAAVLTEEGHEGLTYEVTGPESHTLEWAAARLSEAVGRPVAYHDETVEEAYASRAGSGAPDYEVEGWVTSYLAVAAGELDVVTDVVRRLTGHPAQALPAFLAAHPDSYAHLLRS
jgi:NAD(P)H dehydrogenase (quinone)